MPGQRWAKRSCVHVRLLAYALLLLLLAPAIRAQNTPPPLLPSGIAYDAAGNLYIADTARHQVFESTLGGALTVVAGTGEQGFAGDGGAATSALLNGPQAVAVAPDGTLYIADTGNQRVRAVAPSGAITSVAGTGVRGFGGDGGPGTAAPLNQPLALAVDGSGALLIADSNNHRVRRLTAGVISTVAGTGVEGFSGDGGPAVSALLDTPAGVSVAPDGRILLADSHNHRLRVIALDGTITTLAGTGQPGFSGDGGAAIQAQLSLPRGVAVLPGGAVLFADSNNHRLRSIDARGVISTLAGDGVQGSSADTTSGSTANLDGLHGVGVSAYGLPVFSERSNRMVRALVNSGALFSSAGLAPARTTAINCTLPATAVYGAALANVSVQSSAGTPQGVVAFSSGNTLLAQGALSSGALTQPLSSLGTGTYAVTAHYRGDGFNPAATCAPSTLTISPAAVLASAADVSVPYGTDVAALTGTITGILPQDASSVHAAFATSAPALASIGTYPITASLTGTGAANYTLRMAPGSGSLHVTQAPSTVTVQPGSSYAGLPLTLQARVAPPGAGTPTGSITFSDAGVPIASAQLAGGVATAIYLGPAAGAHNLTASYAGDPNFLPATSAPAVATVSAMPDFQVAVSGTPAQTVQTGTLASFAFTVSSQPGPFTGAVTLSASGLPAGATVVFSPTAVVPGSASAVVTMSVPTSALAQVSGPTSPRLLAWALLLPCAAFFGRRRKKLVATVGAIALLVVAPLGCGTRVAPESSLPAHTYTIQVTGTGTNLAGAVTTHTTSVTLNVE